MKLQSEFEDHVPVLPRDARRRRESPAHRAARRAGPRDKPELSDAHRLVAEEAARRENLFQQSVAAERTRGDALSKRFEEALKQAKDEPITKPTRDFDLE